MNHELFDEGRSSLPTEISNAFDEFEYSAFLDEITHRAGVSNAASGLPIEIPAAQLPYVDMGDFFNAFGQQQDMPTFNPLTNSNESELYKGLTEVVDMSVFDLERHQATYYLHSIENSSIPSMTYSSAGSSPSVLVRPSQSASIRQREITISEDIFSGAAAPQQNSFATPSFFYTRSRSPISNEIYPYGAPMNQAWKANRISPEASVFQKYAASDGPYTSNALYRQNCTIDPSFVQQQHPPEFSIEKAAIDESVQFSRQHLDPALNAGYRLAPPFPLDASSSIRPHEELVIPEPLSHTDRNNNHQLDNIVEGRQELKGSYPQSLVDQITLQPLPNHLSAALGWRLINTVTKDRFITKLAKADKEVNNLLLEATRQVNPTTSYLEFLHISSSA